MFSKLAPLVMQLGTFVKDAIDYYTMLKAAGKQSGPDIVAAYIRVKLDTWNPQLGGKAVLDNPTRDAAARFIAGVAINVAGVV